MYVCVCVDGYAHVCLCCVCVYTIMCNSLYSISCFLNPSMFYFYCSENISSVTKLNKRTPVLDCFIYTRTHNYIHKCKHSHASTPIHTHNIIHSYHVISTHRSHAFQQAGLCI